MTQNIPSSAVQGTAAKYLEFVFAQVGFALGESVAFD
jgi:hypothetical protein